MKEQDICDPLTAECKKYLKMVENFQKAKTCCFISTFTAQFTTFLPSNNHVLHATSPKTPLKNQGKSKIPSLAAGQIFSGQN
jgi:hypothetical protein